MQDTMACDSAGGPYHQIPDFGTLLTLHDESLSTMLPLAPELSFIVSGLRALSHIGADETETATSHLKAGAALKLLNEQVRLSCGSLADAGEEVYAAIQTAVTRLVTAFIDYYSPLNESKLFGSDWICFRDITRAILRPRIFTEGGYETLSYQRDFHRPGHNACCRPRRLT